MILVALAIAASTAVGVLAERRDGVRAQALVSRLIWVLLWVVLPFVSFFTIARLHLTTGIGVGLVLAYAESGIVGLLAWWAGTRLLHLSRPQVGALIVVVIIANTGFLGVPLCAALLGSDTIGTAIAYDTLVNGPMFFGAGFAIGAAFGRSAGESRADRLRAFALRNPPLVAVVLGLLAPEWLAPDVLHDAARVLVFAVLPVGFFILGVNLESESEHGVRFGLTAPVAVAVGLRLVVAPLVMLALSAATVKVPDTYLVEAAMPSGINALVVAHAYGLDLRLCASALATSTAIVIAAALALAPFV